MLFSLCIKLMKECKQTWFKKWKAYCIDLRNDTKLVNLKALPFNKIDDVDVRFNKIKKKFTTLGEPFKCFLNYFENTYIKTNAIFKKELWNYNTGLSNS